MTREVVLLGAGGHAKVVVEALLRESIDIAGFLDPQFQKGEVGLLGLKCLGDDADIEACDVARFDLVNGLGSLPGNTSRADLSEKFRAQGFRFLTVVHPSAVVAADVEAADGVQIMAGAIIQPGVEIFENAIVNTGAIVDHDCVIENHVHVAPGATLSGGVRVCQGAHVGTGASVIQNITIGRHSVVGAGAIVTKSVGDRETVFPARPTIRKSL